MNRAFFLDRDGTINVDREYIYKPEDWEFKYKAVDAIRLINQSGYLAVVITNQSGIGRGYYTEDDLKILHEHVNRLLAMENAKIDAYYYCPHKPDDDCGCRKPKLGMFAQAINYLNIDMKESIVIGDKMRDIENVKQLGCNKISLVGNVKANIFVPCFDILYNAVNYWISNEI